MPELKQCFIMGATSDGYAYIVYGNSKEALERLKNDPDWRIEDTTFQEDIETVYLPEERYQELVNLHLMNGIEE